MSSQQGCQARVSECLYKSVSEYQARVSSQRVKQECPEKSVLQECQAIVSHKSVPQESQARVSHKSVPEECQARVFCMSGF